MSIFKNYFDRVDTAANTAAECEEIVSRAAGIKKRRKIATSAVGGTLAVMMTTTMAVSAAGGWNITEIIGRWFKGDTELITDNISVASAENSENNYEFLDIVPNGTIIDKNMIIFFLDVTRNDGNNFDCSKYAVTKKDGDIFYDGNGETFTFMPEYRFDLIEFNFLFNSSLGEDIERKVHTRQYIVDDGDPLDNKMTIAFCCDRTTLESQKHKNSMEIAELETIDASDIRSVKIRLGGLEGKKVHVLYQNVDGVPFVEDFSTERINGSWSSEFTLDPDPSNYKTITVEPDRASTFKVHPANLNADGVLEEYDYSFNVEKITVSPMSVSFELSREYPEQESYIETVRIGEIIMKNGDTITINQDSLVPCLFTESGNTGNFISPEYRRKEWQVSCSVMLTELIDPDDVEAVRLGDTTFVIK